MDYMLHKNYVASVLCVNKNIPGQHCNGKCHLKKQLDQDTKQQEGESQKSKAAGEVIYLNPEDIVLYIVFVTIAYHYFYYLNSCDQPFFNSVFHPPGTSFIC